MGGGHGGGGMNWAIGIDMYTLMCIKWMTNQNVLYKKVNKIKFKNSKKKKEVWPQAYAHEIHWYYHVADHLESNSQRGREVDY